MEIEKNTKNSKLEAELDKVISSEK